MKKVLMLAVAGMFSLSAAAYACDGAKHAGKAAKAGQVAKKDAPKPDTNGGRSRDPRRFARPGAPGRAAYFFLRSSSFTSTRSVDHLGTT
jgi:hypothetical protein